MKNLFFVLLLITGLSTLNANIVPISINESKMVVKEDPNKICRYYAIIEANNTNYPYGSPAWQQEYKFYFNSCMAQINQ